MGRLDSKIGNNRYKGVENTLNQEKKLYDFIKQHNGFIAMRDADVAKNINVRLGTIPMYKKKLRNNGYIETKIKYIDGRAITLYKIVKEYDGQITWD